MGAAEISTIEQIVKLCSNYGIALVLAVALVIILIRDKTKYQKLIMETITKSLSSIKSHPNTKEYTSYDAVYSTLQSLLEKSIITLQAARISVIMYHNGGQNLVGIPFQKMSIVSEAVSSGIARVANEFQSIQKSSYSALHQELDKAGYWAITDVSSLSSVTATYSWLSGHNTISCIFVKIVDILNESLIGFVCVEYIHHPDDDFKSVLPEAINLGESVSAILGVNKNIPEISKLN